MTLISWIPILKLWLGNWLVNATKSWNMLNLTTNMQPGRQSALDRFVALKVFRTPWSRDSNASHFHRAARALARLRHPQVVTLFDHGLLPTGERFIVQEHIEGRTLEQLLLTRPLSLEEVIRIGVDVLTALEESHRLGILHRQIHPSCVYLSGDEPSWHVRVGDFALPPYQKAQSTDADYSIPEAGKGEALTERSDLFCVGRLIDHISQGLFSASSPTHLIWTIGRRMRLNDYAISWHNSFPWTHRVVLNPPAVHVEH